MFKISIEGVIMPVFIVFLTLTLVFAVICGKTGKYKEKIFVIFRTIFALTSMIGLIIAIGPSKSSSGTQMTAALNKLTGGWSDTILLGFLFGAALNITSMGVSALSKKLKTLKEEHQKKNGIQLFKKKLVLPRIAIILLSGILAIMFIVDVFPQILTVIGYAIKPDGIHHVKWDNSMILKSSGIEQTGITYTVGLGYIGLCILFSLVLFICFIVSLISLIKAIKHNWKKM
jgi:uncharacterized BrkB/YihY/UPF0761 family membrane protein